VGEGVDGRVVELGDGPGTQELGQQGRGVHVGHRVHRPGQVEGVGDLGPLPGRAHEDRRRPEQAHGMDGHDELHPVGHHEDHAVTPTDAADGEVAGERVAQPVEVSERPVLVPAPQCITFAESVRGPLEGLVHQDRFHWKHSSLI
jgi:hypothetical protein